MNWLIIPLGALLFAAAGCGGGETSTSETERSEPVFSGTAPRKPGGFHSSDPDPAATRHPTEGEAASPLKPGLRRSPFQAVGRAPAMNPAEIPETVDLALEPVSGEEETPVNPEDVAQEGDRIFVPPEMLPLLLPGINTNSFTRTEPVDITQFLAARNLILTNYQQLVAWGVTNYRILRTQWVETLPAAP